MAGNHRNPSDLSAAERQEQIAGLLARGFMRLKESQYASGPSPAPSLDFSAEQVLSGGDERDRRGPKKKSRPSGENTTPALNTTTLP